MYSHALPVKGGVYRIATSEVSELDTTLVRITTDTGLSDGARHAPSARRTNRTTPLVHVLLCWRWPQV